MSGCMSKGRKPAVTDVFFALSDETRLVLLSKIGSGPLSATALSIDASVTRQAIVKHLQVLESAGLVTHEKQGREVLYALEARRIAEARAFLETISAPGTAPSIDCGPWSSARLRGRRRKPREQR